MVEQFWYDLRLTLRSLRRSPGLVLIALVTFTMGIGFTVTMYSIVRGATRPLPFDRPESLVLVTRTQPRIAVDNLGAQSFDVMEWARQARGFEGLAAFAGVGMTLAGDGARPARVSGTWLTPEVFGLLRARPMIGRLLLPADSSPGAPPVVVLSDNLWRSRFGADSAILGRRLRLDGTWYAVAGVMPPRFGFPVNSDLWLPLRLDLATPGQGDWVQVMGRLREGTTLDAARGELSLIAQRLAAAYPASHGESGVSIVPFTESEMPPGIVWALRLMVVAVSFVLLIACANIANLLLARASARGPELAVRVALGAPRRRIVTQQLGEALLLSLPGALLGLVVAHAGVRAFAGHTSGIIEAFWMEFRVDGAAVAVAATLAILAAVASGLLPAIRASSADVSGILRDGGGGATGLRIGRVSRSLVTIEFALACGLLVLTATFGQGAMALRAARLPFDAERLLSADVGVPGPVLDDPAARARMLTALLDRVRAVPGISGAALAGTLPGRGTGLWSVALDARPSDPRAILPATSVTTVTPEFLGLIGGTVLRGRWLTWQDAAESDPVAVVNAAFAARFSPERDPIGRSIWLGTRGYRVVGVVPDLMIQDVGDRAADGIYLSMLQRRPYVVRLLAGTRLPPLALSNAVRDAVETVSADLPVYELATLRDAIFADKKVLDAMAVMFLVFGCGALFLTMIGLYGIVAFSVRQRTREIGIRVALGATRRHVLGLVARQGMVQLGVGGAAGLGLAFGMSRALAAGLEELRPAGVATYLVLVAALVLTAVLGLWRPARQALAVEPASALRREA